MITGMANLKSRDPPESVKEWPLIGEKAFELWSQIGIGADILIQKYPEQIKTIAGYAVSLLLLLVRGCSYLRLQF